MRGALHQTETAGAPALAAAPDRRLASAWTRWRSEWALALLGLALLGALVYRAGARHLLEHLRALGWRVPLIFAPYALASWLDAAGWRATFTRHRPALRLLYLVRLAGEAVNNVTPTAYLGGEPVKAYVLHRFGVPLAEGTTSVILAKTALTVAQILFVILGFALMLLAHGHSRSTVTLLAGLSVAGAAVTALLVYWQRHGLVARVAGVLQKIFPRARLVAHLARHAPGVDGRLRAFYVGRRRDAALSVLLHLAGWIAGAAEVFVIMALIGHSVTWTEAVTIEALAQPARLLGVVVPGTLGVQEAGGMLIFRILGLPTDLGLALMLLKRVREIGFSALGLGLLPRLYPRHPPPAVAGPRHDTVA